MRSVHAVPPLRPRGGLWLTLGVISMMFACGSKDTAKPPPAEAPQASSPPGATALSEKRTPQDSKAARQTTAWRYELPLRLTSQKGETLQYPNALPELDCERATVELVSWTGASPQAARMSARLEGDRISVEWPLSSPEDVCVPDGATRTCLVVIGVDTAGGATALQPTDRCFVTWQPKLTEGGLADSLSRARAVKALDGELSSACDPSPSTAWRSLADPVVAETWTCTREGDDALTATLELWTNPGTERSSTPQWASLRFAGEGAPPKEETLMGWYMTFLAYTHPDGTAAASSAYATLRGVK